MMEGELINMIKTKIIETTERYDKDGTLIEKTVREETVENDAGTSVPPYPSYPLNSPQSPMDYQPYCTATTNCKKEHIQ